MEAAVDVWARSSAFHKPFKHLLLCLLGCSGGARGAVKTGGAVKTRGAVKTIPVEL